MRSLVVVLALVACSSDPDPSDTSSGSGSGSSGSGSATKSGFGAAIGDDLAKKGSGDSKGSDSKGSDAKSDSGSADVAKAGSGSDAKAGSGSDAKAGSGGDNKATDVAKAGSGSDTKAGSGSDTKSADVAKAGSGSGSGSGSSAPATTPRPAVTVPGDLAAIKFELLPNWERDVTAAGTFSLSVKQKSGEPKVFTFSYGYDDPKLPADREQYKKALADAKQFTVNEKGDRQRGASWYLEGVDGDGAPAFRYLVTYGGKRLLCYGTLYKDAESTKMGDIRDEVVNQAKKICESIGL